MRLGFLVGILSSIAVLAGPVRVGTVVGVLDELGHAEAIPRTEALARTSAWEREAPGPVMPQAFDYAAEHAALACR
jgi:hypothetical protein